MKNVVKIFCLLIVAIAMSSVAANAQIKGEKAIGVSLALGNGSSFTNYGIIFNYQKSISNRIRLEGEFSSYFKKDYIKMYDISVYGHYLFKTSDKLVAYPLVGIGFWDTTNNREYGEGYEYEDKYDPDDSVKKAISFGGGVDYTLIENLFLNAEAKYKFIKYENRLIISVGIGYRF
jgi:Outer membrane protein W